MRRASGFLVPVLFGLSAAAFAASASFAAPAPGALGGGFIEFLLTGDDNVGRAVPVGPGAPPMAVAAAVAVASAEPDAAAAAPAEEFQRQEVDYSGPGGPGAIVIDTERKFLFLVEPNGRAIRYGVGVGRPGFEWAGVKFVSRKAEWPDWTPPPQMLLRRPDLPTHMAGGLDNPLGARALYLGSSMFRIHGTNEPETIGRNVSSGCIRMMNDDVIDLYNRAPVGTKVIVM